MMRYPKGSCVKACQEPYTQSSVPYLHMCKGMRMTIPSDKIFRVSHVQISKASTTKLGFFKDTSWINFKCGFHI